MSFEVAATDFRDPLALSRYDEEHSEAEERWLTLGQVENGQLVVVSHTFEELSAQEARVRLISAREATAHEREQYERGKFYRPDAVLDLPVYLDARVRDYLTARAKAKGVEVNDLVNELLKRDIELIEAAK